MVSSKNQRKIAVKIGVTAGAAIGLFSWPVLLAMVVVMSLVLMLASAGGAAPEVAAVNPQGCTSSVSAVSTSCPPCGGAGDEGSAGTTPPGVGLNSSVPEPMRSEFIAAAAAAGIPAGAVAAIYLTEQGGFSFMYRFYDTGLSPDAFTITADNASWRMDLYGTNGMWPTTGSKFRGAFQFGPVWESTYQTAEHPDVYRFGDAVFGAAQYLADLGATSGTDDGIRAAARSYNGQIKWVLSAGSIRNPDPTKFKEVRDLYAEQVVRLASALSAGTTAPTPTSAVTVPTSSIRIPTPSPSAATSTPATSSASTAPAAPGSGCGGGSAGGVPIDLNGPSITIPIHPDVDPALQGKVITAPNKEVAAGIAYGLSQLGLPYVWGGGGLGSKNPGSPDDGCIRGGRAYNACQGPLGFDCSGLSWTVMYHAGLELLQGNSGSQAAGGQHVPLEQAVAGDLLTYGGSSTHHVAVSLGWIDGKLAILEAPSVGDNVQVVWTTARDINGWASRYWTGP